MQTRRRTLADDAGSRTGGREHGRRRMAAAAVLLLLALVAAEVLRPFQVLQVQIADGVLGAGRTVLILPARDDERFEVRYVHSYNHFNIREYFEQSPDRSGAVVVDQYIDGNGAGIGEVAGETVLVTAGDGWERLDGLRRPLGGPLRVRIGAVARHELVHRCRGVALVDIAAPGSLAEIGWARTGLVGLLRARAALVLADPVGDSCAPPGSGGVGP